MAGDFIRWQKGLHRKPEIEQIAKMTGLDTYSVAARCMAIWEWADEVTTSGVIEGSSRDGVDRLAEHKGFCAAMEATRPHPWVIADDLGVTFVNYDRHNGQCAKHRIKENERLRRWREARNVKRVAYAVREEKRR